MEATEDHRSSYESKLCEFQQELEIAGLWQKVENASTVRIVRTHTIKIAKGTDLLDLAASSPEPMAKAVGGLAIETDLQEVMSSPTHFLCFLSYLFVFVKLMILQLRVFVCVVVVCLLLFCSGGIHRLVEVSSIFLLYGRVLQSN